MSDAIKICPICSASNHRNAAVCWNCGTSVAGVETRDRTNPTRPAKFAGSQYDFHHGETDLYENAVYRTGQRYMFGCFGVLVMFMIVGLGLMIAPPAVDALQDAISAGAPQRTPTDAPQLFLPTVTQGPPTNTPTITVIPTDTPEPTATREPCMQTVQAGDTLYDLASRCGYRTFEVFPLIVEINNLSDPGMIIQGQRLEIPWPTEIPPPPPEVPATQPEAPDGEAQGDADTVALASSEDSNDTSERSVLELSDEELEAFFVVPTPTLPPGIQFHIVAPGETMYSIIASYDSSVEALRNLNPELTFTQCNYGEKFGGDRCNVILNQGQQIRVPAPEMPPTPTPPPTGDETATPTPTATFNAPVLQSPADRAVFRTDALITLRWVPTGTLADGETYRIHVEDRTAGIVYVADTFNTSFVVPLEWQGINPEQIRRHEYAWHVKIININAPDNVIFRTDERGFTWETRLEG